MIENLLGFALVVGILASSAWITHRFTRAMYRTCAGCGTLNAKRRTHCRSCGESLDR